MSTVRTNNILDASGGNTATINSMTPTADSLQGFRNRIINGDMRIDQRNAGASITVNNSNINRSVDRWWGSGTASDGVYTMARSTSTPPTGFTNFLRVTVTTADASIGASNTYYMGSTIEGLNVSDLGFGSANAKTITISFLVRSSVTGTFSGSLLNGAENRSYPFTFSISAANTWETKSVTIAGDTTGTWATDNTAGMVLVFDLGNGSNWRATAGSWTGAGEYGATGAVTLISTLNATFDITGVQLEVGSVATPFERRDYGRELILCQRYFQKSYGQSTAIGTASSTPGLIVGKVSSNTVPDGEPYNTIVFPVTMRATPTVTIYGYVGGSGKVSNWAGTDLAASSGEALYIANNGFIIRNNSGGTLTTTQFAVIYHYIASNEL
jgi:hypothetical protein